MPYDTEGQPGQIFKWVQAFSFKMGHSGPSK